MSSPLVSVVLPVLNGEDMISEALQSISSDGFDDLEIVVVDDGSSDSTVQVVLRHEDSRLRLIQHEDRRGTAAALNTGIRAARGHYIARLDADDLNLAGRIARQVSFLDANPDVNVVGMGRIVQGPLSERVVPPPYVGSDIGSWLVSGNILAHPSTMMRRSVLDRQLGPYQTRYAVAQDYRLWVVLAQHGCIANLQEPGIVYREHANQASKRKLRKQSINSIIIRTVAFYALRRQLNRQHILAGLAGYRNDLRIVARP